MPKSSKAPVQKHAKHPATKRFIDIAEIRDNTVIMKDGSLRAVLLVSSINFYLKSEDEQQAIISAYVAFLNSLDDPLQIVIQSRTLNVDGYLLTLEQKEKTHTSELLKTQTAEYRAFIQQLIELGDIMSRRYFVVVPFSALSSGQKSFFKRFGELWSPAVSIRLKEEKFQKYKYDLDLRVSRIIGGLTSMGLQITQLDTQGLIELYYATYNPDLSDVEKLVSVSDLQVT